MSSDTILTDPDGGKWSLDNLSTQKWLEGRVACVQDIVTALNSLAGEAFGRQQDERAKWLRQIANEIEEKHLPELQRSVERHKRDYPSRLR